MMKLVSLLRVRLIHISSSYWKSYCSFEIILEMGTVNRLELKSNVLCNSLLQKYFQFDMNYILKCA